LAAFSYELTGNGCRQVTLTKHQRNKLYTFLLDRLDEIRIHLARPDALLQLAVFGLLTGLLSGAVIVLFRILVEDAQEFILPGKGSENYEALPDWARFALPIAGAIALALMFRLAGRGYQVLGVARVMERMNFHQGYLTERGFLLQFFGAAFAIVSGQSVGREGPHVFLGAAAGSLMGQYLSLPNNSIRTFVGCGTAAGIAASFNTPLAGVIFALEVVMMEYTVASFIPVILAAVSATVLSNAIFGDSPAFIVPVIDTGSAEEMLLVIVLGVIAGAVSAGFIYLLQRVAVSTKEIAMWWRLLIAGVCMGLIGFMVPEVMGIGYDSVQLALQGEIAITILLTLAVMKLLATSIVVGLGVPGGMIGPTLFIGAMLGAAIAGLSMHLPLGLQNHVGMFALLGMGAMMSASLQAPLAALTAMLELTDNPDIILPGMLAVVVAGITASELFRTESLFLSMLKASGQDYNTNPMLQALRRVGVASIMERNFVHVNHMVSRKLVEEILAKTPQFILVDRDNEVTVLMPTIELAKYMEISAAQGSSDIDLLTIPGERWQVASVPMKANLQEAFELMDSAAHEALYVETTMRFGERRIFGVLSRHMVENAYRY